MHGMIMVQFESFVGKTFGPYAWKTILSEAKMPDRIYLPVSVYADDELFSFLEIAVELTGKPASELLELFGEHLIPPLIETYGNSRMKSWHALDLLEHVEATIHRIVRVKEPAATPPRLSSERVSETEVVIRYGSGRGLCALARGLIRGVAQHYAERIEIEESECMHRGAEACLIRARKLD
jgi:predicted hydrocarbon binding protein